MLFKKYVFLSSTKGISFIAFREKGKERNVDVREKHPGYLPYMSELGMGAWTGDHVCLDWGSHRPIPGQRSNLQPRPVSQVGIEPSTFLLLDKA